MATLVRDASKRNADLFIDDVGFKYRRKGELLKNGKQRWVCTKNDCSAGFTASEDCAQISQDLLPQHRHESSDKQLKSAQLQVTRNAIKRKAVESPTERPLKIIRRELTADPEREEFVENKDIKGFRHSAYKARSKIRGKLPRSTTETLEFLQKREISTNKGEAFVLDIDHERNIVILGTKTGLEFLAECSTWYMDGTFQHCPKFFYQLFTVHGLQNGIYVPVVFTLLPSKSRSVYECVFERLKSISLKILNKVLQPQLGFTDLEQAMYGAFRSSFPLSQSKFCRFHVSQAWFRKIAEMGLSSEYRSSSPIGKFLQHVFGLPLLDSDEVGDCFAFDFVASAPNDPRVTRVLDFLAENYITEEAKFPSENWAQCSPSLTLTTNACESFHRALNDSFYTPHPDIYTFIDVLLNFQVSTYIKIRTALNGESIVERESLRLKELIGLYQSGGISRFEYVSSASHVIKPSKKN
jgi:hypothetical protein